MDHEYRSGGNIVHELQGAIAEWQDSFNAYYNELLSDDVLAALSDQEDFDAADFKRARDQVRVFHQVASELFSTFLCLRVTPGVKQAAKDLAARLTPGENLGGKRSHLLNLSEPFIDRLDIELAREYTSTLGRVAGLTPYGRKVWLVLMEAALEQPLSDLAAAYLAHVARLLLFGFDVECVVMCRAVLEAALAERLDPAELDRAGVRRSIKKPDGDDEFSLADLIHGAVKTKVFSPEDHKIAKKIKRDGNDVLHVNPGLAGEAPAYVYQLSRLLRKLYPFQRPEPEMTW